jgi:uncharacterized protein YndB with AHSA1/START domain
MTMHVEGGSTDEPIIVMTRTFDAPRPLVWAVFTDPKHVAKWYGGHGFGNEVREMEVRPGGRWRIAMRTPDGTVREMDFVYVEVVRPERIVWKNASHPKPPPGQLDVVNTVTFEDAGRKTHWKLVARFDSIADRDLAMKMGFTSVITQGAEKLNDIVAALALVEEAVR